MDWLDWAFDFSNAGLAAMWSTFVLSVVFALFMRKTAWEGVAFRAGFIVFVVFSVMLTVYNGVHSTAGIGGMFMIAYVSIVAFPTAGIVRLVMSLFRKMRAARAASD